jgi:anti-anti-sigma factor
MQITERQVGDVTVLELKGRMILEEGDVPLRDYVNELAKRGCLKVLIDMKHVTRLDSAGIGMLVAKFMTLHRKGGSLKLVNLTVKADHMLDITRLTGLFQIYEAEEDALRSFGAAT